MSKRKHFVQDRGTSSHILLLELHDIPSEDVDAARNYLTKHAPDVLPILMPEEAA